jgi:hypothetical protein
MDKLLRLRLIETYALVIIYVSLHAVIIDVASEDYSGMSEGFACPAIDWSKALVGSPMTGVALLVLGAVLCQSPKTARAWRISR